MIFRILVSHATTLHHFERVQIKLNRFYPSTLNGSRKDKRVLFEIVGIVEHTMVHCHTLIQMLLHALQNVDLDCAVRETDIEEF